MFSTTTKTLVCLLFLASLTSGVAMAQALTITTPSILLPGALNVPYSQTLTATGGTPPYTWSVNSGSLPMGLSLNPSTGVISGQPLLVPPTPNFVVRVMDSAGAGATQTFSITIFNGGSLVRTAVLSQVVAGGGWGTTIFLENTSSMNAASVKIDFRDDNGNPYPLQLSTRQLGLTLTSQSSSLTFVLPPNTTVVAQTTAPPLGPLQQVWGDVATSGSVGAFAIFRQTQPNGAVSEGTTGGVGSFQSTAILPFDNTAGFVTGVALTSLSSAPMFIGATIWDENGVQLGTVQMNSLNILGHTAFSVPTLFPVTAGKRGMIAFANTSSADSLTGLGLRFSPSLTFTSIPLLPQGQ